MEQFPAEFNPEKIFPLPSKNPELANLRSAIVATARNGTNIGINGQLYKQPCRVHFDRIPVTYRNLMTIHQELSERGFIIHYELQINIGFSCTTKKVSFSEIDPYGNMPVSLILGSKSDAEHQLV